MRLYLASSLCGLVLAMTITAPAGAVTAQAGAEGSARAIVARYAAAAGPVSPIDCLGPAGDPAPGTQAWQQRDYVNQYCATERLQGEYGSPAFGTTFWCETPCPTRRTARVRARAAACPSSRATTSTRAPRTR